MTLAEAHAHDLHILAETRRLLVGLLDAYTPDQLNTIPDGFNNNIIWNAAHCWVTQVLLTRGLGQLGHDLNAEFVATYRKGGAPTGKVTADGIAYVRNGLLSSQQALVESLDTEDWSNYKPYTTSYGVSMASISEGLRFNNVHEAMHFGVMLAQRKLV